MNKNTALCFKNLFFIGVLGFICSGCALINPVATPTTLTYIHYSPSKVNTNLEFDYPSVWVFNETIRESGRVIIGLGDADLLTIPTQLPSESHGTPSDFGRIIISIVPINSQQTFDALVKSHQEGYSHSFWIKLLSEYKIIIDGYDAVVFEYQVEPIYDNGYTSVMFERNIFFIFKDKLYQITLVIAEKDRGGEFEQGYEYFFNSIKIVP